MDKKRSEDNEDNDFVNSELTANSVGISNNHYNYGLESNNNSINKRNYIKSEQNLINNSPSHLLTSNNILLDNKNYKEDKINNMSINKNNENNLTLKKFNNNQNEENYNIKDIKNSTYSNNYDYINSNIKNSIKQNSKNIFDARIFSDDDMSLNKSNKFNNSNNNQNINKLENSSTNSLLLSLNINEMPLEDINNDNNDLKNEIKKIIPTDIYNNLNSSQNQLIINTKEGLKKLFIYLSDSLNNQKKISGSNDYYYNNDLNSNNLLKIYVFIKNILNNFKIENNDTINESLFIINLILPLLPTSYINNICEQLIEIFYYKTTFEELEKNNYLLFKQILRLNRTTFFDKIFSYLKNETNFGIKVFWKKFIYDLIQKNNDNYGIEFDISNNESIINILNEYHKEDLINFCLNLFNYNDLNDISSNNDAKELIKCISNNKILCNINNENNNDFSFKEGLLNKAKDNEALYLIIKNIFDENENNENININNNNDINIENNTNKEKIIQKGKIKRMNKDNIIESNENSKKNDFSSGTFFKGSFGNFGNKNLYFNQENEFIDENNNNNFDINIDNNFIKDHNDIFEVMDNQNIIYEDNKNEEENKDNVIDNKNNNKNNNIYVKNKIKKKKKVFQIDLTEEDEENNENQDDFIIDKNNDNLIKENNVNNNIINENDNNFNNNIMHDNNIRLSDFSDNSSNMLKLNSDRLSNYKEKNSRDSLINYKYSNSTNNEITQNNNGQNEKMSLNIKNSIKKNNNSINTNIKNNYNENKDEETYNNRSTINNNNIFSSFSSFSSFKGTNIYTKNENINNNKNNNINNDINKNKEKENILNNNNYLNIMVNKVNNNNENNKNINNEDNKILDNKNIIELMNNNNNNNDDNNIIDSSLNMNNDNSNIIDNNNILNLIVNNNKQNDNKINNINNNIYNRKNSKNTSNIKGNKYNNSSPKKKYGEEKNFDYTNCLNIIEKERWSEKQQQINILKQELDKSLTKENYKNSNIEIDLIVNLINKKLKDKQQKLVILILELLEIIIIKLEDIFNDEYLPILSKSIINNLNDNNIQLRYKTATVILKILSYNKKDFFVIELIESLKIEKNNLRIELLSILNQYFSQNKGNNLKKANKNFFNILVDPLILCIEDKFSNIRNLAEELIKESSKYIPVEKYYESTKRQCGKVVEDKVNYKINEIYCIDKNCNTNNDNKTLASTVDNANINKTRRNLNLTNRREKTDISDRSKSCDENKKQSKKNNNIINKKNTQNINNNLNIIQNNNNSNSNTIKSNKNNTIDFKNVFRKNINFIENKKYRHNKDMKLGKNFLTAKEKGKLANINDVKPLTQIFNNEYINNCVTPYNRNLKPILINFNKVINNCDINFKSDFLTNLDIILEFIIRLFDFNINNNSFDFIEQYITFIDNIYEKLMISNLKMSPIENGFILHSLIFLSKFKNDVIVYIKKFYILISIDKTFKILFDYNDLNDIEIQKNILDLFKKEFIQGNIDITNDNFCILKKIIKFFYNEELAQYAKNFFREIYGIIGNKIFEEFVSKLNRQDKNIFMNNIDFKNIGEKEIKKNLNDNNKIIKTTNNISNNKIINKKNIKNNNNNNNNNNNINYTNAERNNPPLIVKFNNERNNKKNNINNYKKSNTKKISPSKQEPLNNINPKDSINKKKNVEIPKEKNDIINTNNKLINNNNTENNNNSFKNNNVIENNKNSLNNNKIKSDKIDVANINEIIELLNDLSLNNDDINIEELDMNNIINIISNKSKLVEILKNLFDNPSNFNNNKKILFDSIEVILDSLSNELNLFFNINTMSEKCPKDILLYIIEIISIFFIISSKKEIIIMLKDNILNKLLILFLNYLEIDKEEKISDINNDFNSIFKDINKITLNIIQKSNREIILIVLLRLISNFKEESGIALLGINCLVNLIKITDFKKIDCIKILTEIIIAVDDEELISGTNNKKANELFLKTIKKLLNQLVVEKKQKILKDYQKAISMCNIDDEKVCNWIQKILEHNKY